MKDLRLALLMCFFLCTCHIRISAQTFTEQTDIVLPGINSSSIAWGDYDNDNDLDLLLTGYINSIGFISRIYRNNSDSTFTDIDAGITGVMQGCCAWGDYDSDGNLDILLTGRNSSGCISRIYKNNGNSTFTEQTDITIPGVNHSSVAWGDYDNDGDLDFILSGELTENDQICKIYRNDRQNKFIEIQSYITPFSYGDIAMGDYDNDGDLDILVSGHDFSGTRITKIYRNDGVEKFTDISAGLAPESNSSVAWGDYDNDGDLDIVVAGSLSRVYTNNGDHSFSEATNFSLPRASQGSVAWGDYDNDGYLDILLTGYNSSEYISRIYRNSGDGSFADIGENLTGILFGQGAWGDYDNDGDLDILLAGEDNDHVFISLVYSNNSSSPNNLPTVPSNLHSETIGDRAILAWGQASDTETNGEGLSYNIVVSTSQDIVDMLSPMSDLASGYRRIAARGNACLDTTFWLDQLPIGKYYWSVQAIDHCFKGSMFAELDSFTILPPFSEQTDIILPGVKNGSADWSDLDNDGDLDILLTGNKINPGYDPISTIYVNQGDNTFTEVEELSIAAVYNSSTDMGDYDNDGDLDILLSGATGNPEYNPITKIYKNNGDNNFSEQTSIVLEGVYNGSASWGDHDNDGDLDIVVVGSTSSDWPYDPVSRIYENNKANTFTEQSDCIIKALSNCSFAYGDYDNDGDSDILLSGAALEYFSRIYKNKGPDSTGFTEQIGIYLEGAGSGALAWGDYDNDGDLDILLTGNTHEGNISRIYRNDGADIFTDINAFIRGIMKGDVQWGDFDNDGDLDILFSGYSSGRIAGIFRNEGNDLFTEIDIGLPDVYESSIAWGDYDNDSDLDILLTGSDMYGNPNTKIYKNNGNWENNRPGTPTGLSMERLRNGLSLKWAAPTDDQTPQEALSYNIRIGTSSGGNEIVSPVFDNSGDLALPAIGNCQHNTHYYLDAIPKVTHYWSVQAVDHTYLGGLWAEEQTFFISALLPDFVSDTVCLGNETSFSDNSISSGGIITAWNWDFGDGSSSEIQNPVHTFVSADTFTVSLTVSTAEDTESINKNVFVKPIPYIDFTADIVSFGEHTTFINASSFESGEIVLWNWDFGDGYNSTSEIPDLHKYQAIGSYEVSLEAEAENGCSSEIIKTVTVCETALEKPGIVGAGPNLIYLACTNDSANVYRWYRNDELIQGANSFLLIVENRTGIYRVEISEGGYCFTPSDDYDLRNITSISDLDPWQHLKIYPNPTPGMFTLEMENHIIGELIIDIFGETGAQIINIKFHKETTHFKTQIDLSGQPPGAYLIGLMLDQYRTNRTLIVK